MISRQGTFDYVATVAETGALPWTIALEVATDRRDAADPSLAGPRAWLKIDEAGLTPNAGYERGIWRPQVSRARFRVCAGRWSLTASAVAAFHVDMGLVRALRSGDALHLSRTGCGGVGISALRDGQLVYAVGAITSVPLGEGNSARIPHELIAEAEAGFRRQDPTFSFPDLPVELRLTGQTLLLPSSGFGGRPSEAAKLYGIFVLNGFRPGLPGVDECAAVSRHGLCSDIAAKASAQLLAADSIAIDS